jgi:hypothetical protein
MCEMVEQREWWKAKYQNGYLDMEGEMAEGLGVENVKICDATENSEYR